MLLKNEGSLLPLAAGSKVAVIGDFAKNPRYQGAGSSMVNSTQVDVMLDKLIDSELNVIGYQQGFDRHGKPDAALQKSACELATQADTVILCMGLDEIAESEGLTAAICALRKIRWICCRLWRLSTRKLSWYCTAAA